MNLLLFNLKTDADDDVLGFTTGWINALAAHYERVYVITMSGGRVAVADNVEVYSVGKEKGYSELRRAWEFYRLLFFVLRRGRISACFAHMMPLFAVMAAPLLMLRRIPTVLWYAHGHVPAILKLADRLVDRIVTSSDRGCRLVTPKLRVIGQGIEVPATVPATPLSGPGPIRLLYVGRLSAVKGIHLLLEAVRLLKERTGREVSLTLVGGPLTEADRHYVAALKGQDEAVRFVGSRPFHEVRPFYDRCDIFLNPSNTGSMDKTVLEAMAAERLVITGNEAYDTEEFRAAGGYYVPNDAAAIAAALEQILQADPAERQRRAAAGRRWVVEQHSLEALAARIAAEIKAL